MLFHRRFARPVHAGFLRSGLFAVLAVLLACPLIASTLPSEQQPPSASRHLSLTLFHLNDWHGTIAPSPASWLTRSNPPLLGGPGALGRLLRRLKLQTLHDGGRYLVLDAGDRFQGSLEVNMSRGRLMTDLWNALGITVATLGNHDFDYGQPPLADFLRDGKAITLCANLTPASPSLGKRTADLSWGASRLVNIGEARIGLFGLITDQLPTLAYPEHLEGLALEPAVTAARREVARLRKAGADLVVLLSHCGHDVDCTLARDVPGIDLIVGGHTDDHLTSPRLVGSTMIVQTRGFGSHLGVLRLTLGSTSDQGIAPGASAPRWEIATFSYSSEVIDPSRDQPDPEIEAIIASHGRSLAAEVERPITMLPLTLPKRGGVGEADFGGLICRTIAEHIKIPAACFQAGGIRADLPAGTVRFRDLYQALPFEHFIVTGELQGKDLMELAAEGPRLASHGLSGAGDNLRYDGKPVSPDGWYRVAFNDFLAMGGDNFPAFRRARNVQRRQETVRGLLLEKLETTGIR